LSNTKPTKTGDELWYIRRVGNSCSTSGTHRITLVNNLATGNVRVKEDGIVTTTNGTYPCSSATRILFVCSRILFVCYTDIVRLLHRYCSSVTRILFVCYTDIVRLLHGYCSSVTRILFVCYTDMQLRLIWWRPWNVRSNDFNITIMNSWSSSFRVSSTSL